MTPSPLTSFEIQKFYQKEPRFNGVYSINNLPKIKDGTYIINLDNYFNIGTQWILLYALNNNITFLGGVLEFNIFQQKLKNLLTIKT